MRVLVLDDHRLFLDGLCHVLAGLAEDIEIVEAQATQRALDLIDRDERFELILADIEMPGLNGLAFLSALQERRITTPVAIISGTSDVHVIRQALDRGALGFVPKSTPSAALIDALRQVLDGEVYLPSGLWDAVYDDSNGGTPDSQKGETDVIGQRQLDVLRLMAEGQSNKQIAIVLNIAEATVKSHIGSLFKALGVKNRTACVREAARRNLIKLAG